MSFGGKSGTTRSIQEMLFGGAGAAREARDVALGRAGFGFKQTRRLGTEAADFWRRLLRGDKDLYAELLGPELTALSRGATGEAQRIAERMPRGGGMAQGLAAVEAARQVEQSRIASGVRPQAARELAGLAELFRGVSGDQLRAALGFSAEELGRLATALGPEEAAAQRRASALGALGRGIGMLLAK